MYLLFLNLCIYYFKFMYLIYVFNLCIFLFELCLLCLNPCTVESLIKDTPNKGHCIKYLSTMD